MEFFSVLRQRQNEMSTDQEDKNVKNDSVEEDNGPCQLVTHDKTTLHTAQVKG